MRCKSCHYSLANLTVHRCPECGRAFDPTDPTTFTSSSRRLRVWHGLLIYLVTLIGFVFGVLLLLEQSLDGVTVIGAAVLAGVATILALPVLAIFSNSGPRQGPKSYNDH